MLKYLFLYVIGAALTYMLNGIIISFSENIRLKEGYCRLFWKKHKKSHIITALCGGLLFVMVYFFYENWYTMLTVSAFIAILMIVAAVDQATMEIPNTFVLAAFLLGIISIFTMPGTSLLSRITGVFAVSVPLLLLTLVIPGAFGGGDIKLMAACGLFLGTKLILLSFAFAVLTGGLYGIWLLASKKKSGKEHFAFGPFLCLGMAAALFIGERVWNWYLGFLYI